MFITFEGIEGCGKSTQAGRLFKRLNDMSMPVLLTREPGGTAVGESIRQILLDSENQTLVPLAELLLYAADRAQHVRGVIAPMLEKGRWVLCDRFTDATVAYQGYARGLNMELIKTLNEISCAGIRPDITFLFDLPVETGLERAMKRNRELGQEHNARFEKEALDFHEAVRIGYLALAEEDKPRFLKVDAILSEDEIEERIFTYVMSWNKKGAL